MAKNNFLVLIRKRIEEIHKEYSALRLAYETLEKVAGLRGRKVSIPDLSGLLDTDKSEKQPKKGKRGRPRKYPITENKNPINETRKSKGKRGRKKLNKSASIVENVGSNKAEIFKGKEKPKQVKVPKVKKSAKSAIKRIQKSSRTRVPNLAGRITDIIKGANRFVTNAEITDKLTSTYPSKDKAELSKYLSVVMSQMKGRKEAGVVVKDHKGKRMRSGLWGLPNWFENGKPKNEYLK